MDTIFLPVFVGACAGLFDCVVREDNSHRKNACGLRDRINFITPELLDGSDVRRQREKPRLPNRVDQNWGYFVEFVFLEQSSTHVSICWS